MTAFFWNRLKDVWTYQNMDLNNLNLHGYIMVNLWQSTKQAFAAWGYFHMGMGQYLLIPFLVGWSSIYQLFWCSPGVQGFDTLPYSKKLKD